MAMKGDTRSLVFCSYISIPNCVFNVANKDPRSLL